MTLLLTFFIWRCACFSEEPYVVRLGDQNLVSDDDKAQPVDYGIKRIIRSKQFNYRNKEHDIALFELSQTVKPNAFIRPACLHQEADHKGDVIAVTTNVKSFWLLF